MSFPVTAAFKAKDYQWYTWHGGNKEFKNRSEHWTLKPGHVFGLRSSRAKPGVWKIVFPELNVNRTFAIKLDDVNELLNHVSPGHYDPSHYSTGEEPAKPSRSPKTTELPNDLDELFKWVMTARTPSKDQRRMIYIKKAWHVYNDQHFNGRMKEPNFKLGSHGNIEGYRGLNMGQWAPGLRQIRLNPRLFYGGHRRIDQTLIHEMCHQAVSEIDNLDFGDPGDRWGMSSRGHGPAWQDWMKHCGLNPSQYWEGEREEVVRPAELRKKQRQEESKIRFFRRPHPEWEQIQKNAIVATWSYRHKQVLVGRVLAMNAKELYDTDGYARVQVLGWKVTYVAPSLLRLPTNEELIQYHKRGTPQL